jgi:hypothetical protein
MKHHGSGLKPLQQQQQLFSSSATGTGRRSPLQQALHSKHHAVFASSGGYIGGGSAGGLGVAAAGVVGSSGSFTGSGGGLGLLGGVVVPKVQRVMSESVKPEAIAKGFAGERHRPCCYSLPSQFSHDALAWQPSGCQPSDVSGQKQIPEHIGVTCNGQKLCLSHAPGCIMDGPARRSATL